MVCRNHGADCASLDIYFPKGVCWSCCLVLKSCIIQWCYRVVFHCLLQKSFTLLQEVGIIRKSLCFLSMSNFLVCNFFLTRLTSWPPPPTLSVIAIVPWQKFWYQGKDRSKSDKECSLACKQAECVSEAQAGDPELYNCSEFSFDVHEKLCISK